MKGRIKLEIARHAASDLRYEPALDVTVALLLAPDQRQNLTPDRRKEK
jgi:hypothetical protein